MPIETIAIDDDQVARILSVREGHFSDMKAKAVSPAKLTKALSAFANADGGELYVGIDEHDGTFTWNGFIDEEAANGHLQIFEQLFPLGDGFRYEFLLNETQPGLVMHVIVLRSGAIRKASDGIVYLRRGAASQPLTTDARLRQLERDKGLTSFETETVNTPVEAITNSELTISFMLGAFPLAEPDRWLRMQRVIVADKPTVAGLLLYSDLPQADLPKRSSVKLYRYKTSDTEGKRETLDGQPVTIEGPLYNQIRDAVRLTTELVESISKLGDAGLAAVSYPPETLHEIITNALIHRDYGVADDVHIRVFDNRVEVESPGRLAGHVSPANILDERFARNGNVVRLINKFPDAPNKDVGEGLNTAFDAMKKLQLKDPVITELDHSVLVNIRHEKLASPEQMIMEHLQSHPEITNRIVRELSGIGSENKVKTIFQGLMKRGQIERVPNKRGNLAAYRLVATQPEDPSAT
ncbi:ATP-dependent DNA helicase RecG [Microbacterium sp. AG157]|uniref:ATP-binding protein n=1 Tax=Microbacterium sp. AG157 TaxID=2183993 RepID=UPI000E23BF60|nr:ATP-binding protein [Microbacterium sp. AG157]REC98416.1 ATP-dependent DNA helicase RecG [Microbacterium sp. AG157]